MVGCGVGRGSAFSFGGQDYPNWAVEFISAYDLDTLSCTPNFKPLSLWRLLTAVKRVTALGVNLQNINGLLNLYAWARSLDGHVVPHGNLPDDFAGDGREALLMITQNSLRTLRHEVAIYNDVRVAQRVDGRWIPIERYRSSAFADDDAMPLYSSEIASDEGWLSSVYLAPRRAWWGEISMPGSTEPSASYERWRLMAVWLSRAVPKLDGIPGLPVGPIKWRAVFEAPSGGLRDQPTQRTFEETRTAITVAVDHATATVTTTASPLFEDAIHHPENIAERALVDALLEGTLTLARAGQDDRPHLLRRIVTSPNARYAHSFAARTFRDMISHRLERGIVLVEQEDDAIFRLGLGWSVRERSAGGWLSGKVETTLYLNALLAAVEDELCKDLQAFNRKAMLKVLLLNHEACAIDRSRWRRTSAALLALHTESDATFATISSHAMKLSGAFQASYTLMEMAICESPTQGGREPGELDLSRLMAKAAMIYHIGGWSDAIRWDVMEPTIRITALGDVHAKFDYIDDVIEPHAREATDVMTTAAAEDYAENLKQVENTASVSDIVDPRFLDAWEDEFGTTIRDMSIFVGWLESRGIERGQAVMCLSLSDFENVGLEGGNLDHEVVMKLLDKLTLLERRSWRDIPEGFEERDRQPWRYRRRLSVVRRPILKIASSDTDSYLVAPGIVRDTVRYLITNYMRGDFPSQQLGRKMRAWAAREADSRGAAFTKEVAAVLREYGWETETEVKITKILRRSLNRDYGDVDVLAWRRDDPRILIIECKDLQFKKTYSEICEQLSDFRGEMRPNGKPDYLRRHLDRMDVLRGYPNEIVSYLKLAVSEPILDSHLIFKRPVPMKYALRKLSERVTVSLFDEIRDWAKQGHSA